MMTHPEPVELTRDLADELRDAAAAGQQKAAYVIRYGAASWVTASVEGVIANIQADIVQPDPDGGYRVASL